MLFTNKKTDVATNRFGGDGDVIINHYIDEKLINGINELGNGYDVDCLRQRRSEKSCNRLGR